MQGIFSLIVLLIICNTGFAQAKPANGPDASKEVKTVEAGCGECVLDLGGKDCKLAVRFNGRSYFVEGTGIDDHGDAHADDGFCNMVRKAKVQGEVKEGKFVATYFKLLPLEKPIKKSN